MLAYPHHYTIDATLSGGAARDRYKGARRESSLYHWRLAYCLVQHKIQIVGLARSGCH
ncbi:MAG TPA: hypothetical protein VF909_16985 [Roseiflexaceae bacterium]